MLIKLILLLQLTLSLQGKKIKKTNPIRKYGGPQRDKILRRLKEGRQNNVSRYKSLGIRRLFGYLPRVVNFYGEATFDTVALLTTILFLLKKLVLLSILLICKVLDSLLNANVNGN